MKGGVRTWLVVVYAMIAAMVVIGGITRLTGSGLSMVEWRPLMGALPPLDEAQWLEVFAKYQASPQYQQVNDWMGLVDFKRIFFWEWFHRLFGRLIGVVFFVPWAYFAARGRLKGPWLRRTFVAFLLGGAQGLLGWFMVKSGLVDIPQVSHYRLAAHLSLAIFVALYVIWLVFDLTWPAEDVDEDPAGRRLRPWVWGALALVGLQTVWGAFMAGSRAGYLFSTFPDMNGHYLPFTLMANSPAHLGFLDHPVAIHFVHRNLGYIVALALFALWAAGRKVGTARTRLGLHLVLGMVLVQVLLGIFTVVTSVQIGLAAAHQTGALALLTLVLFVAHALRRA